MEQPQASKYLFTVSGASPGGQAYQHYLDDYNAVYHTKQILRLVLQHVRLGALTRIW